MIEWTWALGVGLIMLACVGAGVIVGYGLGRNETLDAVQDQSVAYRRTIGRLQDELARERHRQIR